MRVNISLFFIQIFFSLVAFVQWIDSEWTRAYTQNSNKFGREKSSVGCLKQLLPHQTRYFFESKMQSERCFRRFSSLFSGLCELFGASLESQARVFACALFCFSSLNFYSNRAKAFRAPKRKHFHIFPFENIFQLDFYAHEKRLWIAVTMTSTTSVAMLTLVCQKHRLSVPGIKIHKTCWISLLRSFSSRSSSSMSSFYSIFPVSPSK